MIPRIAFDPTAPAPLDGIRVVDLSRLVAGNMVSLQLADQGAEVIKIEDPKVGDPLRAWRVNGLSLHWKVYARNKKSLAINLRPQAGRDALLDLLATSQVLIENYRPGTLEQMGLGPEVLHARNPGLVIVRITGFGQDGPYRDRPGFGTLVEAMSGFASKNGFGDRPPVLPPLALADMVLGLYGAYAVMIALRVTERGGRGQIIDLPLLDPMISVLGPEAASYRVSGEKPLRTGSRSLTTSPRNVYGTSDGRFIAISASIQAMAERLFKAIGRADMIDDPRFRTNTDRVGNIDACDGIVADWIAARTLGDAMAVSLYKSIPYNFERDFSPVSLLASSPFLIAVHPSVPARNFQEFLQLARAKPGSLSYGSAGNGVSSHLSGEALKLAANINILHVPYKGQAPAMTDLLGGQIAFMFANPVTTMPHVRSGKLRALAVTSPARFANAPEIPTIAESGVPGYEAETWFGIAAPAGTPEAVVNRLSAELAKIMNGKDTRSGLESQGAIVVANTPAEFAKRIQADIAKWRTVIRSANISLD